MIDMVELVETQCEVIAKQSELIGQLFDDLCEHLNVEEAEAYATSETFTSATKAYNQLSEKFGELCSD
jgi:hypothetical protein